MIGQARGVVLSVLAVKHDAQAVRLQPFMRRATGDDMVDKIISLCAGTGVTGCSQRQRAIPRQCPPGGIVGRQQAVEIPHHDKGFPFVLPFHDPVLNDRDLAHQRLAGRFAGYGLRIAASRLQMHDQYAQAVRALSYRQVQSGAQVMGGRRGIDIQRRDIRMPYDCKVRAYCKRHLLHDMVTGHDDAVTWCRKQPGCQIRGVNFLQRRDIGGKAAGVVRQPVQFRRCAWRDIRRQGRVALWTRGQPFKVPGGKPEAAGGPRTDRQGRQRKGYGQAQPCLPQSPRV
ncbi:hypothetical protein MSKU15_3241 [Komagataeibacter diospyri]|nr:hypothetical protein MSKU15_3241 [Komagataeibacter diospyri]